MIKYLLAGLLIGLGNILLAQDAMLKGTVTTADGKPAESVTVALEGTSKMAVANKKGSYEIKNIKPGSYLIRVSLVGVEAVAQRVHLNAGAIETINFILKENEKELQEVVVSANKMGAKGSEYVSKMPLRALENAQVYNVISADLLKQQVITTYDDALKNIPGIQRLWESTGRGGDGGSYYALRGFEAQVSMLNGLPGLTNGTFDPANIEKIEVVKGPSGTLFGSSVIGYGGLVNNVTKKPHEVFGGEVSYTGGSFGLNRFTADVNTPVDKDGQVLARFNTAYQSENSFQDQGFRKSFFFAPTLSYKLNDRLSFLLVAEFMHEEKTNPAMLFLGRDSPLQFKDLKDLNYNPRLSLTSNDLSMKNPRFQVQAQMNYKLSDNWTSQTVVSSGQSNSKGYYHYIYDNENGNRDFGFFITKENSETNTTDIQQNFIGDFKIGKFRNRLVAGVDYFNRKESYGGTGWAWLYNVTARGEVNYKDPITGEEMPQTFLTGPSVDNVLAGTGLNNVLSKTNIYSAYISDVFNLTDKLLAMASLRVDQFDNNNYKQTALSPKFGLIYQPIEDKISVFANYMNGFRNLAPTPQYLTPEDSLATGSKVLDPEQANQFEAGVKTNLVADRLTATLSYYDIRVANQSMPDPQDNRNTIQGGKSLSRGFEADIRVQLFNGLDFILGYSYNYSKVLKGELENIWFEEGKRPIWAGPEHLLNLWATYQFSGKTLSGFGMGFGGNYASDNATLNNTLTGVFILPAYTVLNASLFYNSKKIRVSCNLNNLANKEYYGGAWSTVNPQKPRNIAASIAFKF